MSAPTQNGQMNGQPPPPQQPQAPPGPPPLSDGTMPVDPALVTNALLNAVKQCASSAAAASGQDAKDFMLAALNGAQAIVILDPSLSQGGTPLQHDAALAQINGQTQQNVAQIQADATKHVANLQAATQLRQAKEAAAAPTPARRKNVTVSRDQHGRASSYSVSES